MPTTARIHTGLALVALALGSTAAAPAMAAPPTVTPTPAPIHGGDAALPCEFPTAVALYENMVLCSGTLVHPRLVLTAAHCIGGGTGPSVITFGESIFEPARTAAVDHCRANPAATGELGPWDFAYCLLAEAVDDVPPTPILMGCETSILTYGQEVVIGGYGATDRDQSGIKHTGLTIVSSQAAGDVVTVGAEGTAACSGDSGGPAFVRLGDGGWRAFGIVSGGLSCDEDVTYVTMHSMIAWAEAETAMDFTPCHDADGTWNPNAECVGASTSADLPEPDASWPSCEGPRSVPSSTCGPAFGSEDDLTPPQVTIVAPLDGMVFGSIPADVEIIVEASELSDDAAGVERVELWVAGMLAATDDTPPWSFGASFPAGEWTLEARAIDWRGNEGSADPVTVFVGEAPPEQTETGTGESESESGNSEDSEIFDGPGQCSCRSAPEPVEPLALALGGLILLGLRRRSHHHHDHD